MPTQTGISSPQAVTIRPFNKGVILNDTSAQLERGALTRCINYDILKSGLRRRGGYNQWPLNVSANEIQSYSANNFSEDYRAIFNAFKSVDQATTFLLSDNFVYTLEQRTSQLRPQRISDRAPTWADPIYAGWAPIIIEQVSPTSTQYFLYIAQSLFTTFVPQERDLIELRESQTQTSPWAGINSVLPFSTPTSWEDGSVWATAGNAAANKNTVWSVPSIWLRVKSVGSQTIDSVAYYKIEVDDNTTDQLLSLLQYGTKTWNALPHTISLIEGGFESTFYTTDATVLQYTEASRIAPISENEPAVYFTSKTWNTLRRVKAGETLFTPIDVMSGTVTNIGSVLYHRGYLLLGNYFEGGVQYQNSIRWSSPTDCETFVASDYLRLQSNTGLVALASFGQYVVVFFADTVYIGYPSNVSGLPFRFERIETGGIGLASPRGYAIHNDSLYFISQTNIHRIGLDGKFSTIGDPVAPDIFFTQKFKSGLFASRLVIDGENDRLVVALTEANRNFVTCYTMQFETNGWAQLAFTEWATNPPGRGDMTDFVEHTCTGLGFAGITSTRVYDDYTQTDQELAAGDENRIDMQDNSYDMFNNRLNAERVWVFVGNQIFGYDDLATNCQLAPAFPCMWETPDYDFDMSEQNKVIVAFGLKIAAGTENNLMTSESHWMGINPLVFRVYSSRDRGGSWSLYGRIRIQAGKDEGVCNQIFQGSLIRFRVVLENRFDATIVNGMGETVQNTTELPFSIIEFHMRPRVAGRETSY